MIPALQLQPTKQTTQHHNTTQHKQITQSNKHNNNPPPPPLFLFLFLFLPSPSPLHKTTIFPPELHKNKTIFLPKIAQKQDNLFCPKLHINKTILFPSKLHKNNNVFPEFYVMSSTHSLTHTNTQFTQSFFFTHTRPFSGLYLVLYPTVLLVLYVCKQAPFFPLLSLSLSHASLSLAAQPTSSSSLPFPSLPFPSLVSFATLSKLKSSFYYCSMIL